MQFRSTKSPRTHGSGGSDTNARDMLLELDDPTVIRAGGMPGRPGGGPDSPETDAPDDEEEEEDEEASPT